MAASLNTFAGKVKSSFTGSLREPYHGEMEEQDADSVRRGIGLRLKAAREAAGKTQLQVAEHFGISKQNVSAWESGRGMPDAARLRAIAKLYRISSDAILFEDSLTAEAMQLGAQFDNLTDTQQKMFRALWLAYFEQATSDEEVSKRMPPVPKAPSADIDV